MLEELTTPTLPKTQVTAADVLASIGGNPRKLRFNGKTYDQRSEELNNAGLRINTSALRRHLMKRGASAAAKAVSRHFAEYRNAGKCTGLYKHGAAVSVNQQAPRY